LLAKAAVGSPAKPAGGLGTAGRLGSEGRGSAGIVGVKATDGRPGNPAGAAGTAGSAGATRDASPSGARLNAGGTSTSSPGAVVPVPETFAANPIARETGGAMTIVSTEGGGGATVPPHPVAELAGGGAHAIAGSFFSLDLRTPIAQN
jgi:hypothetical protein